jgi:hypothetical protein
MHLPWRDSVNSMLLIQLQSLLGSAIKNCTGQLQRLLLWKSGSNNAHLAVLVPHPCQARGWAQTGSAPAAATPAAAACVRVMNHMHGGITNINGPGQRTPNTVQCSAHLAQVSLAEVYSTFLM